MGKVTVIFTKKLGRIHLPMATDCDCCLSMMILMTQDPKLGWIVNPFSKHIAKFFTDENVVGLGIMARKNHSNTGVPIELIFDLPVHEPWAFHMAHRNLAQKIQHHSTHKYLRQSLTPSESLLMQT